MKELIDRQAAIDVLDVGAELLRRVLDDMDVVGADRENVSRWLALIEAYISDMKELPSAQPEILACGEGELIAQPEQRSFSCGQENDLISRQAAIDAFDAQCWERINIPICKEIRNAAKDTIKALPSAKRWIPAAERFPDKSCFYICTKKNRLVKAVWYSALDRAWEEDVIAWMPLPEPYKKGDET